MKVTQDYDQLKTNTIFLYQKNRSKTDNEVLCHLIKNRVKSLKLIADDGEGLWWQVDQMEYVRTMRYKK